MIGKTLAHYEITGLLGKGGMGEVFRALDTQLGREVAIKILPAEVAGDPERAARFEREARTLASLQHPNVASIYGFAEDGGVPFLAMELIEGEDLAQRLARGPLPLEDALHIAREISVGLEAAHEKQIVHRDLKPANIKVDPAGAVKVLDFGLARAFSGDPNESGDMLNSPTITAAMTNIGVILGTAAYMSPEQAKGKLVDRRADIWSFGVILHEMLTGQQMFTGETVSETMAEVMKGEITFDTLPSSTPAHVRALLKRCLNRDPQSRLRDIGEARIALDGSDDEVTAAGTMDSTKSRRTPWIVAATCLFALVAVVAWHTLSNEAFTPRVLRFRLATDHPITVRQSESRAIAISPDGNHVAALGNLNDEPVIYLRRLDSFEAKPLPGTEQSQAPRFSPDGRWLAFKNSRGFYKVNLAGGSPVFLGESSATVNGVSWASDGYLYFAGNRKVYRLADSGGVAEIVYEDDAADRLDSPFALPDGRGLLLNSQTLSGDPGHLMVLDLATGKMKNLGLQGASPRYLNNGVLIFAQADQVMGVRFDLAALEARGTPTPVLQGVWISDFQMHLDVAQDGTVAFLPALTDSRATILLVDRAGLVQPIIPGFLDFRICSDPRLSPDGRRLVISADSYQIWILDLATETPTLVSESGFYPVWSADGKELIYGSARNKSLDLFHAPSDLSRPETVLLDWENNLRSAAVSPDGTLIFREEIPGKGMDLKMWSAAAPDSAIDLLTGPDHELAPAVSPDGHWLAYVSDLSSQDEIYVTSFPTPTGRIQISNGGGTSPAWSPDGQELFYMAGDAMIAVQFTKDPTLQVQSRQTLFKGSYLQYRWHRQYEVHPDGEHFIMIENPPRGDVDVITGWFGEIERTLAAEQ
ncbi:MAG: serine/threonine protein kinase/Tol biopolymer transport system component [Candidatus Krumholzibacteriia bacterium]|jgi:serine/threonine protein kinase/Tol biopolymer transport system component